MGCGLVFGGQDCNWQTHPARWTYAFGIDYCYQFFRCCDSITPTSPELIFKCSMYSGPAHVHRFAIVLAVWSVLQLASAPHMGYSQDELQTFYDQLFYGLRGLKQHCVGGHCWRGFQTRSYVLDCVDKCAKTCFTVSFLKLQTDSPKCKMRMILGLFEAQLASRGGSTLVCIHLTCAVSTVMQEMIWI